ncbi:hypothetical protein P3T43_006107 [Paraburkholderia sp. GAS41]|uniref:hypothetical protein n=1 Tax=Paraburkholderia sp. GAS41 TaxID=3035134 RepID=UPI003D2432AE
MNNMQEHSAKLIDLVEKSGMRAELEARVEMQQAEKRQELIVERARLIKEGDEVMPPLDRDVALTRQARELAEQKCAIARRAENYALQRAYGTRSNYGTAHIDAQIERIAPKFMQEAFDALQEPIDFLGGTVWFGTQRKRVGWNFHNIDVSNVEEVAALRQKCKDGQAKIKAMMYQSDASFDEQRIQCVAIVEDCISLTRPHLKDDKHWVLHQQCKERAKKK